VRYTPDWEPLSDALRRVRGNGGAEDEAKIDVCRAIADGKIRVRVTTARSEYHRGGDVFSGGNVVPPLHLRPSDLDWVQSRPFGPWSIGPLPGQHYEWIGGRQDRTIGLIELSTFDVETVLCGLEDCGSAGGDTLASPIPPRKRSAPAFNRARRVIGELFPDGVPDQGILPNAQLCRAVSERLKALRLPEVGDDSILRAAGQHIAQQKHCGNCCAC
jgi:hypothetical protein